MFDIGAMFSSANDSQTSPTSTNGTANYTLDDHGFVSWLNSTNSSVSALVSDIRTDGEKFDMTNVSILCVELQNRTNGYLADIEKFNLTASLSQDRPSIRRPSTISRMGPLTLNQRRPAPEWRT